MAKSKFFRVFVEGFTASDGRKIEASWIEDIVSTFNVGTYTPRINCEHIKGFSPEPPFNAYGSVSAVKAQTDELVIDGETVRRRALYAQIEPNEQLLKINKQGQKIFTSVEISPDFGGTGKVGLIGLAVTDNPASLGTEALSFSALKPMFDARKQHPDNLFSAAIEADIGMEDGPADTAGMAEAAKSGILAAFATMFKTEKPKEQAAPPKAPANDNSFDVAAFSTALGEQVVLAVKPAYDTIAELRADFAKLKAQLESEEQPQDFTRAPATGGGGNATFLTDC
ncbi:GPO family capsid scaffolding protein [Sphingomonas sp. IC081]|uniref:GPO family capsid scaffolding protein n=1 Tax=Sphingomonas sp. IC081 TaxID=304378 RepID=UPI00115B0375|nr:GPO family capsid scaffolding protein [Sphingomonas sp. IC081]QDK32577.1 phage capsid protein [Sphingomonas sp. IC081]